MEKKIAELIAYALTTFKEKYFTPMEKRLEPLETHIKDFTPFDDSELQEKIKAIPKPTEPYDDADLLAKIEDVEKSIPTMPEIPEYEAFDPSQLEEKIDAVENYANDINDTLKAIKPFDASQLEQYIKEVEEAIPVVPEYEAYDDAPLKEMNQAFVENMKELNTKLNEIPEYEAYDDTAVLAKIEEVEKSIPTIPEIPEAYDDTKLATKLRKEIVIAVLDAEDRVKGSIPEPTKEFDDTELQKSINAIQEAQQEIQKELARPIKISLGEAKYFNGEEANKGQIVLHKNAVYVNRIDSNDSEPSEVNKSYQLLMQSPREIVHTGVWDKEKEYKQNDIAMWNNNSYMWVGEKGNVEPNTSEQWKILAKGVRGRKGEKGLEGQAIQVDYAELLQKQDDEITILKSQVKELIDATRTN